MEVLHPALDVADVETQAAFYEDLLGLEKTGEFEVDGTYVYVVGGRGSAEIQFREVDERDGVAGLDHLAIAADDLDATIEAAVEEWGSTLEMEPQNVDDGVRVAFISDPEGYTVELIEVADD